MGAAEPTSLSTPKHTHYHLVHDLSQGRTLLRHPTTSSLTLSISHNFPSQQLLQSYLIQNKALLSFTHPFFLNAYDYQIMSQTNICSKMFKIVEYYEYVEHTLEDELKDRMENGRMFGEEEIMAIVCSVVMVMAEMERMGMNGQMQRIGTKGIVISQDGVVRVASSNYTTIDYNQPYYCSPQQLKPPPTHTIPPITSKSTVFTLGITFLSLLTLQPLHHLYDLHSNTIDIEQLQIIVQNVEGQLIREIIKKMVKIYSYDRISFNQLEEMIKDKLNQKEKQNRSSSRKRKGYSNRQNKRNQQENISILEESICRIRPESKAIDHNYYTFTQPHNPQQQQPLQPCPADPQDLPLPDSSFLPSLLSDPTIMDQYQRPIGHQPISQQDYSGRQSMLSCNWQTKMTYCSQRYEHKPLADHSNRSNITKTTPIHQHTKYHHQQTEEPQYVVQQLNQGRYQGYKLGKYRHGFGTFYYPQGGKYCGQWHMNKMQGRGVLYYPQNKIAYQGEWNNDQLHGYGVLYNQYVRPLHQQYNYQHLETIGELWIKYQGYFQNDLKHGQGTLYLSNGENFRGIFQNDYPNGNGQFKNVRGEVINGFWLMGALNTTQ